MRRTGRKSPDPLQATDATDATVTKFLKLLRLLITEESVLLEVRTSRKVRSIIDEQPARAKTRKRRVKKQDE